MKIYHVYTSGDVEEFCPDPENPTITIGGEGRGNVKVIIPILGISDDGNYKVGVVKDHPVIAPSDLTDDGRCIAIIHTTGGYDRGRHYDVFDVSGTIEYIATGRIAWGAAGRVNGGPEYLAIIHSNTEFRMNSKYTSAWFTWDGQTWLVETPAEHRARKALENMEAIQWL